MKSDGLLAKFVKMGNNHRLPEDTCSFVVSFFTSLLLSITMLIFVPSVLTVILSPLINFIFIHTTDPKSIWCLMTITGLFIYGLAFLCIVCAISNKFTESDIFKSIKDKTCFKIKWE